MTHCPHLSICPFAEMRAPTRGVFEFSTPGLLPRLGRRFNQAVTPIPQPVVNVTQPAAPSGPLNPGETVWRTLNQDADIRVQARMGWQVASYVVVLGGCCICGWYWPSSIPACAVIGVADIVAAVVFIRLNWDILCHADDNRLVTRKRDAEQQPVTDTNTIHVKAELKEGKRTLYDEFDISDYGAWHQFCRAVHEDGRNFSQNESERNNVPPRDWDTVSEQWTKRGWMKQAKRRGTPELRARGRAWVKAYAMTPPEVDR